MPLHLLGKKSWNVYNYDNIERVKRDEAEAAAKEAAEEQHMQEVDAERRIRQLRGLPVDDLEDQTKEEPAQRTGRSYAERDRKRRRIHGEDDTDRDIRYAKEAQSQTKDHVRPKRPKKNAPLYDTDGHINLFAEDTRPKSHDQAHGNPEVELERARQERKLEDQLTMRFSNASGFKQAVDKTPWYHGNTAGNEQQERLSKNVFGEEDPGRRKREEIRIASDDPLATIQRGVKGVRQAEKDRNEWKEKRRREIDDMIKEERREATGGRFETDDLEGFSLDAANGTRGQDHVKKHGSHHRHRHRSKSPRRHRHRHRHREKRER